MEENQFKLLKWNGKYGEEAKFIVEDMKSKEQSLFTPGEVDDVVWTTSDLVSAPEFQNWQDFGNETVSDLEDVAF